jgi:hypothetical protein
MPGSKVNPRVTQIKVDEASLPKAPPPAAPSASQATLAAN